VRVRTSRRARAKGVASAILRRAAPSRASGGAAAATRARARASAGTAIPPTAGPTRATGFPRIGLRVEAAVSVIGAAVVEALSRKELEAMDSEAGVKKEPRGEDEEALIGLYKTESGLTETGSNGSSVKVREEILTDTSNSDED